MIASTMISPMRASGLRLIRTRECRHSLILGFIVLVKGLRRRFSFSIPGLVFFASLLFFLSTGSMVKFARASVLPTVSGRTFT